MKFDMFSAGSIMYNIATGNHLFKDAKAQRNLLFLNKQCNLSHVEKSTSHLSNQAKDLMMKLLDPNPKTRVNSTEALNHDWFKCHHEALVQGMIINK
jgi:serine/threonine protein kinase